MKTLRAIDLCAGAGGWAVAARGLPIRIDVAVDWDRNCCLTYALNHPRTSVVRADLKVSPLAPSGFDLVLGGIPCQWLTTMRTVTGRGPVTEGETLRERALLDSVLSWIRTLDPPWWCLEDIPQIQAELPPFTPGAKLDSAWYSPQRRRRYYVGRFPVPRSNGRAADVASSCIRPGPYRVNPLILHRRPERSRSWDARRDKFYPVEFDRKWPTVVAVGSRHEQKCAVVDPALPSGKRQIEWQEAAIAQGFPEDYVFVGNQTAVNQMVANAVQVDTARAILTAICSKAGLLK